MLGAALPSTVAAPPTAAAMLFAFGLSSALDLWTRLALGLGLRLPRRALLGAAFAAGALFPLLAVTALLGAALRAVALDETLAEAQSALGWARLALGQWAPAETALTRAIALDPAAYRGYEGLARLFMFTGRPAEQLAAAHRGLELDPFSVQATRELALALNMNGRCDETLELLRPLKELTPPAGVAGVIRGQCYVLKQMWPEAIAEFRWAMETSEARAALAFLGYAFAREGRTSEARSILADLLTGRRNSHGAFGIAVVYAGLREYEQAFAWLEKAMDEGSLRVYIMDPLFEDLHRDPRFDRLLQRG